MKKIMRSVLLLACFACGTAQAGIGMNLARGARAVVRHQRGSSDSWAVVKIVGALVLFAVGYGLERRQGSKGSGKDDAE